MAKTGRRTGEEAPRVKVVATQALVDLRKAQTRLNHFLWTTEICYGHVLARASVEFSDLQQPVEISFGHVRSAAWFPNSQGRQKFRETTGHFLAQTQQNTMQLYRLVLLGFYTLFEEFLEESTLELKVGKSWGPFVQSLSSPALVSAPAPLPLHSVLCADLCRLVRNLIVHEPSAPLPVSLDDDRVVRWGARLLSEARANRWPAGQDDVQKALQQVIGQVANHLKQTSEEGKEIPPELFHLLFAFTNLDQLACQMDEALLPAHARLATFISRPAEKIRRQDLIIQAEGGAGAVT